MFSATGLFKNIPCPSGERCPLTNCIFSHAAQPAAVSAASSTPAVSSEIKNSDDNDAHGKNAKRRKLEYGSSATASPSNEPPARLNGASSAALPHHGQQDKSRSKDQLARDLRPSRFNSKDGPDAKNRKTDIQTVSRPISPPPVTPKGKSNAAETSSPCGKVQTETLNPRLLPNDPAGHSKRTQYLKALYEGLKRLNDLVSSHADADVRKMHLSNDALIKAALDEEEDLARGNPSIYANLVKLQIVKYKKMRVEEWLELRKKDDPREEPKKEKVIETGLTVSEEVIMIKRMAANQKGLDQWGYVTKPPTEDEIAAARKGVESSGGYEQCDRCKTRFQVFPDRREDGALTSGGICIYHWGRPYYPKREKTDAIRGVKEPRFSCCNEALGSKGCTEASTHVFKVSESKRLAAVLPFENTPPNPTASPELAVCFDCEMGYSSYGLELIRLTAVTWPRGDPLVDVLVKPLGQVLDLNSRFSGVFPDQFVNAEELDVKQWTQIMLSEKPSKENAPAGSAKPQLKIVSSPAVARSMLLTLISPETPLVGHALENDLNAIRLVHPMIVDTVLLFPHPRGLPFRFGLRHLASQHLDRQIQMAGAAGHDSLEDARATADIARWKVKTQWEKLQAKGWTVRDGIFYPPAEPGKERKPAELPVYGNLAHRDPAEKKPKRSIAQVDGSNDTKGSGSDAD